MNSTRKKEFAFDVFFTNRLWVIIIALFCAALWGSAFPVLKVSYEELGIVAGDRSAIIVLAGMRFFLAGVLIFVLIIFGFRQSARVKLKIIPQLLLLGILQISLMYFLFYNGLAYTYSRFRSDFIGNIHSRRTTDFKHVFCSGTSCIRGYGRELSNQRSIHKDALTLSNRK